MGADTVRSAPHETAVVRQTDISPSQQLVNIISGHYGGRLASETLTAMFLVKERPLANRIRCPQISQATGIEEYAMIVLQSPSIIPCISQEARRLLATIDLPEGGRSPTLVLSPEDREYLQMEIIYRMFLNTCLSGNVHLLHVAVKWCMANGVSAAMIADPHDLWLSRFANDLFRSASLPYSPLHKFYHHFSAAVPFNKPARSRSLSDLSSLVNCYCVPDPDYEQMVVGELSNQIRSLVSDYGVDCLDDGYYDGTIDHDGGDGRYDYDDEDAEDWDTKS